MSQQMNYDEAGRQRPYPPYEGYESGYQDPFIGSRGQKISMQAPQVSKQPSPGQRLALAIVSLVLLVGAVSVIFGTAVALGSPTALIALGMVCLTIIVVNGLFNGIR
jgi:hypothetical protein